MALRDTFNKFLAAAKLPALPLPKAKPKQSSVPGYKTAIARSTSELTRPERNLATTDTLSFRLGTNTKQVVRDLAASSPDLSATTNAYLRVGIPENFSVTSRDLDGRINVEATQLAHELLRRVTYLGDPSVGYNSFASLHELSTTLGKELLLYGAMAAELVLDRSRLPSRIVPIHTPSIRYLEDDDYGIKPFQDVGGVKVDLDLPTVFIYNQDQSLLTPYADSMFEPAIQSVLADSDFLNSLRRVMRRALHPRLVATLIEEKLVDSMPPEVRHDPDKAAQFINDLIGGLEGVINGLEPEDALVGTDSVEYSYLTSQGAGSGDVGQTLQAVQAMLNSKLAAGAKTLPAVLGRGNNGTSASVETMLFLKNANAIRTALNTLYSRALTQAVRLLGQDVYVEFKYEELDMRPAAEQEAYFAMRQSRVLMLLSLGMISDEEACVRLTGNLPPEGYTPLSGTQFMNGGNLNNAGASAGAAANPDSQTSTMGSSPTPTQTRGPARRNA